MFVAPTKQIRLNAVRGEQLELLSAKLGLSVAETVETLIAEKAAAGVIPRELPLLGVSVEGETVTLVIDGVPVSMSARDAADLAETFRYSVARRNDAMTIQAETMISIVRRGIGFSIQARMAEGAPKVAATPNVITELATQLTDASRAAENNAFNN